MPNFKVGDKVKFLNATGGGIIKKILSPSMVSVQIEEGFEIPTLITELILVEEAEPSVPQMFTQQQFRKDFKPETNFQAEDSIPEKITSRISPLEIYRTKGVDHRGIYLAFVPHDQRWLITGMLDIYLINYTEYNAIFSLFLKSADGKWLGKFHDICPPDSKILLDAVDRESIDPWTQGIIQVLFHSKEVSKVLMPVNTIFQFKPIKLHQENNYQSSIFLGGKSFLLSIIDLGVHPHVETGELYRKSDQEISSQTARPKKEPEFIDPHRTSPREAVVDLHIESLTDKWQTMSNYEIITYQLNYFTRCLESAIKNYLTKVTFIHGVGEGVLKSKMLEILQDYDNIKVRDASREKFGYGATEVLIWHNPLQSS